VSFWSRLRLLFTVRANKAISQAEDPRDTLDYSYEKQLELLQKMRAGVADAVTSRRRIEMQRERLDQSAGKLDGQARQALGQGREDLAREALTRRAAVISESEQLGAQLGSMQADEQKLVESAKRLEAQIVQFRSRKETMKAQYSAAEARAKVGEAVAGIGEGNSELVLAMQRAEDKIAQMQARADALDGLMSSGALEDLTTSHDSIQRELDMRANDQLVDRELTRMKGELTAGETKALDSPQKRRSPRRRGGAGGGAKE
jgi:phage shock protein A